MGSPVAFQLHGLVPSGGHHHVSKNRLIDGFWCMLVAVLPKWIANLYNWSSPMPSKWSGPKGLAIFVLPLKEQQARISSRP
jgi:hypothetical protein